MYLSITLQKSGRLVLLKNKKRKLTFMLSRATSLEMSNTITDINYDDVDRLFGWALFKLKKKYKKLIDKNSVNSIYEGKYMMLDNMIVMVNDVIHDTQYIRLYYPLDDVLRNSGNLTLVSPNYVKYLSGILQLAFRCLRLSVHDDKVAIPEQGKVIGKMKHIMESGTIDHVAEVCNESKKRLKKLQLFLANHQYLIWDLVTRILNANIGHTAKQYPQEN